MYSFFRNNKLSQNNQFITFVGSTQIYDWGSALFALKDGTLEFVGIIIGADLSKGWDSKAAAITVEGIDSILREELGISIFKMSEGKEVTNEDEVK